MRRRILSLGQRLVVAAAPGRRSYEVLAGALARYLRRGRPDVSVYLRGGLAHGEVTPGLSDVDLLVVTPVDANDPGARRRELRASGVDDARNGASIALEWLHPDT